MTLLSRLLLAVSLSLLGGSVPASVAAAAGVDWSTYQGAPSRSGVVRGAAPYRGLRLRFRVHVDGQIYGQALFAHGRVYVATESNSVYAFGRGGRLIFRRHLGEPVPVADTPCGDIDPSGITGTPVIGGRRLYVVAYLHTGHRHVLYALDTRSGRVVTRRDVTPPHGVFQQQRGALSLAHGRVYIPFGGLFGTCGDYQGYVYAVPAAGGPARIYANLAAGAGIWAPAGLTEEPSGNFLAATGNPPNADGPFGYANSVVRLSPGLTRLAYWTPRDSYLTAKDVDIGAEGPAVLPGGLVLQSAQDGDAYLLAPGLRGVGGELYSQRLCRQIYGGTAVSGSLVLLSCTEGLVAVRVSGSRFSGAWSSPGRASTALVARGDAFDLQNGQLRVLRLSDGHQLASIDVGQHSPGFRNNFPSLSGSADLLAAPAGDFLDVYRGL